MIANIDFVAKVAVGDRGVALMSLTETASRGWICDGEPDCVINDISCNGIEDWWEGLPIEEPPVPGIYLVTGSAWFSEDDCEYLSIKLYGMDEWIPVSSPPPDSLLDERGHGLFRGFRPDMDHFCSRNGYVTYDTTFGWNDGGVTHWGMLSPEPKLDS